MDVQESVVSFMTRKERKNSIRKRTKHCQTNKQHHNGKMSPHDNFLVIIITTLTKGQLPSMHWGSSFMFRKAACFSGIFSVATEKESREECKKSWEKEAVFSYQSWLLVWHNGYWVASEMEVFHAALSDQANKHSNSKAERRVKDQRHKTRQIL